MAHFTFCVSVNFEALIIAMSVVGGTILLALGIFCYCCCCRTKKSRKQVSYLGFENQILTDPIDIHNHACLKYFSLCRVDKEDEKDVRQREQRKIRQEER